MIGFKRSSVPVLVVALLAVACGGSGSSNKSAASTSTTNGTPVVGGSVTFAVAAESLGLDPVVSNIPGGGTGGIELAALYDTLMRYDPVKKQFEPRLAQSLTPNADLTVWTLKLRPNITFTDGTPLNADAVVFNLKRLVTDQARSATLLDPVASYSAVDPLTVTINMKTPWAAVPAILSGAPGMIVSPTAVGKLGKSLATDPVGAGAGPFIFDSFTAGESIVLKRNPHYWGGQVYLDSLKFIPTIVVPAQVLQALQGGSIQAAYLRDPVAVAGVKDGGYPLTEEVSSAGNTLIMNNGVKISCTGGQPAPLCTGQADNALVATKSPTSDKRIREAVAASIDLNALNTRIWSGKGTVGSALISSSSKWYGGVAGPKYDPTMAKSLVAQVKAEGQWNGSIRLQCQTGLPNFGEAVKAMLEATGFSVTLTDQQTLQTMIKAVIVKKDFDLACFGTTVEEQYPYDALNRDLNSALGGYAGNWVGYANPTVDTALTALAGAKSDSDAKTAITAIATAYTADLPWLTVGPSDEVVAWQKNIHGVTATESTMVYFDKAWIG